jgi:hypothetical protein
MVLDTANSVHEKGRVERDLINVLLPSLYDKRERPVFRHPLKLKRAPLREPLFGSAYLGSLGLHGRQLLILLKFEIRFECDSYVSHSVLLLDFLNSELGNFPTKCRKC